MMRFEELMPHTFHTVAVVGHARPDGDCLGSITAVYHYLTENYPDASVTVFTKDVADYIAFLVRDVEYTESDGADRAFDVAISVDAADPGRIEAGRKAFLEADFRIVVDHHETNPGFGNVNVIEPDASSTAEVLTGLFDPEKISLRTAESLYTGIVHDSGVFRFSCTSPETLRKAAVLMEKGVNCSWIIEHSVNDQPLQQLRIAGRCLENAVFFPEDRFLYSICTQDMQREFGVASNELGHVVVELDQTKDADVVLFLYQYENGSFKGSLRAKCDLNISKIASDFGGGGHVRAAGFSAWGDPKKIADAVRYKVRRLREEMK